MRQATNSLVDEAAFLHVLVTKEGEPANIPFSTNLGPQFKRQMLYFPMDFRELTLDGLIDTGRTFARKCVDETHVFTCATCIECSLYVLCTVELSNDN